MSDSKILHPNFRIGKGQKNLGKRVRALVFTTTQPAFDAIMNEIDHGRAKDHREVLARALEKYFDLKHGAGDPKSSDSK